MKMKVVNFTLSALLSVLCFFGTMLFALCTPAQAQQTGKVYRIGYLSARFGIDRREEGFRQGLRELGYIEGQNIAVEWRFVKRKMDRLPELAAELVRLKLDVIVTLGTTPTRAARNATSTVPIVMANVGDPVRTGIVASLARPEENITGLTTLSLVRLRVDIIATVSTPAARAAKKVTTTIPIVMAVAADAVENGLVASLSRPGGNITGLTASGGTTLTAKRLELLKEIVPRLSRVGVLWDSRRRDFPRTQKRTVNTARLLGLKVQSLELRSPDDVESAFQAATEGGVQGLLITFRHAPILRGRKRIVALAIKSRIPAIYGEKKFVKGGGLMSYGTDYSDMYRRQANYVDRVLKGAYPGDLPIEQPTKFELLINLKTAKQIGITIPPEMLYRADKVIK